MYKRQAGKQTFFAAMHRSVERLADEFIAMYGPAAFSYYRINTFNDAQIVARKACDEQVDWIIIAGGDGTPVSYTHLDVYKRQAVWSTMKN